MKKLLFFALALTAGVVAFTSCNPNDPELTITLYEYRYDEEGNWVTRYEYQLENDKKIPVYIVERDIKYY